LAGTIRRGITGDMRTSRLTAMLAALVMVVCGAGIATADSVNSPNITLHVDTNRNVGNGAGNVPVAVNTITLAEIAPGEYGAGGGQAFVLRTRDGFAFDPSSPVTVQSDTIGFNGEPLGEVVSTTPAVGEDTIIFELTTGASTAVQDIVRVNGVKLFIAAPEGAVAPALTTLELTTSLADGAFTDQGIVAAAIQTGAADRLVFSAEPADAQAGAALLPAVSIVDFGGNIVPDEDRIIALALLENPGQTALQGVVAAPSDAGVVAWTEADQLRIETSGAGYTLRASQGGDPFLTSDTADSEPFTIASGPVSSLAFASQPTDAAAGEAILVTVSARDAFGNLVPDAGAVTLALGENPIGAELLGESLTKNAVGGLATWEVADALRITTTAEGFTLVASGPGDPVESDAFAVRPAAASVLRFLQEPVDVTEAASLAPPVIVESLDAFGNRATAFTDGVTLSVASTSCGGALLDGATVSAVDGLATFPNLTITPSCTDGVLAASASGLGSTTTAPFDVAPAADARPIPANLLVVRPGKLVKVVAKTQIVLPNLATDDPSVDGGSLRIVGTTGEVTIILPASGWRRLGPFADGSKGFRFEGATCPLVVVKAKVVKAVCKFTTGTLAVPEQGPVTLVLRTGRRTARYCAACGGSDRGNPNKVFKRLACTAPAACE